VMVYYRGEPLARQTFDMIVDQRSSSKTRRLNTSIRQCCHSSLASVRPETLMGRFDGVK
jgi:hypothetical protein